MFHIIWKSVLPRSISLLIIMCSVIVTSAEALGRLLPRGDQMAYMAMDGFHLETGPNWDIMLKDVSRSLDVAITNDPSDDRYPAWSPDGKQIAFHSRREGYYSIYMMDADGSNLRKLEAYNPHERGWTDSWGVAMAAWSPDGQSIAYHADFNNNGPWDLFIVGLDGELRRRLTRTSCDEVLLSWSPDGKQVTYASDITGSMEIYVLDLEDVTAQPRLVSGQGQIRRTVPSPGGINPPSQSSFYCSASSGLGRWHPEWSPDGSQIVFASSEDGLDEIYVVNADGTDLRRVTNDFEDDQNPSWTADGKQILFSSGRGGNGGTQIFAINPDGTGLVQLTFGNQTDAPAWRP